MPSISRFYKVGAIDVPTSPGSVTVTGLEVEPKGILFVGCNVIADGWGPAGDNGAIYFGVCDGDLDQWCTSTWDPGNGTTASFSSFAEGKCVRMLGPRNGVGVGAIALEAAVSAINPDGFTIDFTTVPGEAGLVVYYKIIGGDDVETSALVTSVSVNGVQSISGFGITPDVVIHGGSRANLSNLVTGQGHISVGMFDAAAQVVYDNHQGGGGNRKASVKGNPRVNYHLRSTSVAGKDWQSFLVSMDADGFTFNVADGVVEGARRGWFAIAGGLNAVGEWGGEGSHTGYGFPIGAGLWVYTDFSGSFPNSPALNYTYSISISDGDGGKGAVAHRTFQPAYRGQTADVVDPATFSNTIQDSFDIVPISDGFAAVAVVGGGTTDGHIFWGNPGTLLKVRHLLPLTGAGRA